MDGVSALVDGPRAQRAFALKAVFDGTWSITVEDRAPLTVVVMARGRATFTGHHGATEVGAGDVVLVRGPAPYTFADTAQTPEDIRILPGQVCVDPHGRILAARHGARRPDLGQHTLRRRDGHADRHLPARDLGRLPAAVEAAGRAGDPGPRSGTDRPVRGGDRRRRTRAGRRHRSAARPAGRALRADACSRRRRDPRGTTWSDARCAPSRSTPNTPWTVESLATHVGLSRAALARRFAVQMGEPPLTYLTRWRLALAADLLVSTDLTLAAIAAKVGYANAFALSAAFKRVHGESPRDYRRR